MTESSPPATARLALVDVARGGALGAMAVYHLCWDLSFFGLANIPLLSSPFWLATRALILSAFLLLTGLSLVLATRQGLEPRRFLIRLALIAAGAAAISAASLWAFPDSPIFFGVLHHIAVASVLGLAFLRLPAAATAAAAVACLVVPAVIAHPLFDPPWLQWIGLTTVEPRSNDFVPLLPWFGVVLLGIALGQGLLRRAGRTLAVAGSWQPAGPVPRGLAWAGRHSLIVYLLHQPLLLGALYGMVLWLGVGTPAGTLTPAEATRAEHFLGSCQVSCEKSGGTLRLCSGYCRCVVDDMNGAGLWLDFLENRLSPQGQQKMADIIQQCVARQRARGS